MSEKKDEEKLDLMSVFIKETDNYNNYFLQIKELATNIILNERCLLDFDNMYVRKKLIKYNNNHCFEVLDNDNNYVLPLKSKYPESPSGYGLREQNDFDFSQILKKNKDNFEKLLCFYVFFVKILKEDENRDDYIVYNYIGNIQNLLSDFYEITDDFKVISKHNIEIREAMEKLAEKKPSLRQVLDLMYAGDYKNALKTLADDILEKHRKEYKEKIQQGNETLFDIDKFFNFVNNYNIRHSKNRKENKQEKPQIEPTDEQLKVHLDFGLSIYRLFCIYQDDNDKKSAQK